MSPANPTISKKTCPACTRPFDGPDSAIYCSPTCAQRAKRRRRSERSRHDHHPNFVAPTTSPPQDSPNQAEYTNISADNLLAVYQDILTHIYEKDIKLIGPIPDVPCPPDIVVTKVPGTNYSIAYHRIRSL